MPIVVPTMIILAPGNGSLVSTSIIAPFIEPYPTCCALILFDVRTVIKSNSIIIFLIKDYSIFFIRIIRLADAIVFSNDIYSIIQKSSSGSSSSSKKMDLRLLLPLPLLLPLAAFRIIQVKLQVSKLNIKIRSNSCTIFNC